MGKILWGLGNRCVQGAAVLTLILCSPAWAQTASQITPGTLQPDLQRIDGNLVFSGGTGAEAPPGSDQISISLSGVDIEGGLPELAAEEAAFRTRLTRGAIPVSELFEATADLERAYANGGFILSRVVVPQQEVSDGGRLRIVVVNGFIERIETGNVDPNARRRIAGLTDPLVNKPGLTQAEIERSLLLAGDTPGTSLNTALGAGDEEGGAVLAVQTEFRPVTGFAGFDNAPSSDLGGVTLSGGVEFNSVFGFGDVIYFRFSGTPERLLSSDPLSRLVGAGAIFPLGFSGFAINPEYTFSETSLEGDISTASQFERLAIRLSYPVIRTRTTNLNAQAILDLQRDEQDLIDGSLVQGLFSDRITALRFSASGSYLAEDKSVTSGSLTLSQGINALGARTADEAAGSSVPLSRAGADATFTKLTGSISHSRALADNLNLSLGGRFQTGFGDPLVTSEQFSIVGEQELSAFDSGGLQGDDGWVVRGELSTQLRSDALPGGLLVSPYAFAGIGEVRLQNPLEGEQGSITAKSYGIGVDLFLQTNSNFRNGSVRIELGKGDRSDTSSDETRLSVFANFRI